jgi:hypothetical protein
MDIQNTADSTFFSIGGNYFLAMAAFQDKESTSIWKWKNNYIELIVGITSIVGVILLIVGSVAGYYYFRKHRQRKMKESRESGIGKSDSLQQYLMNKEDVEILEKLGSGNFGVVKFSKIISKCCISI